MATGKKISIVFVASTATLFGFHGIVGANFRITDTFSRDEENFPRLGRSEWPSSMRGSAGVLNTVGISAPVLLGTYFWTMLRCKEVNHQFPKRVARRNVIALSSLIAFDLLSWVWRLRIFGSKSKYYLDDENEIQFIDRTKGQGEMAWLRTNQVVFPILLTIGGYVSGLFPFLVIPIITWKSFLHSWTLYGGDEVLNQLGVGHTAPFVELEARLGRESALESYCQTKHLEISQEAGILFDADMDSIRRCRKE